MKEAKRARPNLSFLVSYPEGLSNAALIAALEAGADDVVPDSAPAGLLIAKLRAHWRRILPKGAAAAVLERGDVKLDRARREVWTRRKGGWRPNAGLTPTELELLALLLERPGEAVERRAIVYSIWKEEAESIRPGTVDKHVESLRRKLGRLGSRIRTVYGVGYAYREEGA